MKTEQRNLSYKPMEEFKWNRKKISTEESKRRTKSRIICKQISMWHTLLLLIKLHINWLNSCIKP